MGANHCHYCIQCGVVGHNAALVHSGQLFAIICNGHSNDNTWYVFVGYQSKHIRHVAVYAHIQLLWKFLRRFHDCSFDGHVGEHYVQDACHGAHQLRFDVTQLRVCVGTLLQVW